MFKFAVNISTLFSEAGPLENRYAAAKEAGFSAVECLWPYDTPAETLAQARRQAGVEHLLSIGYCGDGEENAWKGLAALPSRVRDFRETLEKSVEYAKALECPMLHLMSGCRPEKWTDDAMEDTFIDNLKYAADRLQKEGILLLIEPLNSDFVIKNYFLDREAKAVEIIKKINHPNLKMLLDIRQLQITEGNITKNLEKYLPYTAYVQIAQAPEWHPPHAPGEINYEYVFDVFKKLNYDGWMGLEFYPQPGEDTATALQWVMKYMKR